MPRIRTIKPEFWTSERLATRLPGVDGRQARLLFIALWNLAEDHGVCRASPVYLRSQVFAYDDDVTAADVGRWLRLLAGGGFVVLFERDGSHYVWIRGWKEHQRIDKPSKGSLPEPSEAERQRKPEDSASPPGVLQESSRGEGKGKEGSGGERRDRPEPPPAPRPDPATRQEKLVEVPAAPKNTLSQHFVLWAREKSKPLLAPDAPDNCRLEQHQWARLGEALKQHGTLKFQAAYELYLGDRYAKEKGYPLGLFVGQWEKWVGQAKAPAAEPKQTRAPANSTRWTEEDVA